MTEKYPPPVDEQVRELIRAERKRNVAVQASAGTGKTTLIVDRVTGLLRDGLPIDRLAVVTFTRAAASELRSRIRSRLMEQGQTEPLRNISRAWIETIHGFASRILKEHFNLTGADPSFSTSEGHFDPLEIARQWDAWLLGLPKNTIEEFGDVLEQVPVETLRLIILGIEPTRWLTERDMLGYTREVLERFKREHLAEVDIVLDSCLNQLNPWFLAFSGLSRRMKELLAGPIDIAPAELAELRGLLWSRKRGARSDWPDHEGMMDIFNAAREEFIKGVAPVLIAHPLTDGTWQLAEGFAAKLRQMWDEDRSRLSYDDLLYIAWRAIATSGRLAKCLHERFEHVLIDEFQDTSIDQVNLFSSFLEQAGNLPPGMVTVVADDKQSIYGWRNADIETYKNFLIRMRESGALVEGIITNFRSTGSIIRFVNAFGKHLFGSQTAEEQPFGCDYSPITERPGAGEGEPVLVLSLPEAPDDLLVSMKTAEYRALLQAEWFASYVTRGLESGSKPGDYALLIRSTTHLRKFIEVLERENIPYFVEATRDYRSRPEVADLRELLRCLVHPEDRLAWLHTLRSMFFGLDDIAISQAAAYGITGYSIETDECPVEVAVANAVIRNLRRAALSLPLPDLLSAVLYGTEIVPSIAASKYQAARRLGNLQFILEMVLSGGPLTIEELLLELDEDFAPSKVEEPPAAPSDGSAVTITTIHRAKGLSWKRVVLAAQNAGKRGLTDVLLTDEHNRAAAFDLGLKVPLTSNANIRSRTANWRNIALIDGYRGTAESRRLVYVAATRAEESLVLFVTEQKEDSTSPAGIVWNSVQSALEEDPGCCVFEELEPIIPKGRGGRSLPLPEFHPVSLPPGELFSVEPFVPGWQPEGARIGDMVHSMMEKIDFVDPERWLREKSADLECLFGEDLPFVSELCLSFFSMELPFDPVNARIIGREFPYTVMTDGGLKQRYIDLLLEDDEGLIVVDYKTDAFAGRSVEQVAEEYIETQRHYRRDVSDFFGRPARGYLIFLREAITIKVT